MEGPVDREPAAVRADNLVLAYTLSGAIMLAFGALLIVASVGLGLLKYNSPGERMLRGWTSQAVQQLIDDTPQGVVASDFRYTDPGPFAYVVAQPGPWVGLLVALGGTVLLGRGTAMRRRTASLGLGVEEPRDDSDDVNLALSDEPFDTDD